MHPALTTMLCNSPRPWKAQGGILSLTWSSAELCETKSRVSKPVGILEELKAVTDVKPGSAMRLVLPSANQSSGQLPNFACSSRSTSVFGRGGIFDSHMSRLARENTNP